MTEKPATGIFKERGVLMKKFFIITLFSLLLLTSPCYATIIKGYDTFHEGISIASAVNIENESILKKLYFQKTIQFDSTLYAILAYNANFKTILTPDTKLTLTFNNTDVIELTTTVVSKRLNNYPFDHSTVRLTEILIPQELVPTIEDASSICLTFYLNDQTIAVYNLPASALAEWKKVILLNN
ncbi:hypothetical protein [Propionispira raffinosivorans]|uniref:hypothetical protein n=1 Tax=Propionispira raffinosivorans TaxID=86959 RepID=UPI001B7FE386|nr:hypothetical protein [Propionispira raffinosivorans]